MSGHGQQFRKNPLPSIEELRAALTYDPATGRVFGRSVSVGKTGYALVIWRANPHQLLRRARVAWAMVYGHWPDTVEHLNGVRDDDRISNLADVSMAENQRLRVLRRGWHGCIYRRPPSRTNPSGQWKFDRGRSSGVPAFSRRDFCSVWQEVQRRGLSLKAGPPR